MNIYAFLMLGIITTVYCYNQKNKEIFQKMFMVDGEPQESMKIPPGSKSITFLKNFKMQMKDIIFPDSVESIILCSNIDIGNIYFSDTIKSISFAGDFNSPIDNIKFPSSLTELNICGVFNYSLSDVIFPDTLETLCLGGSFNHSINKIKFPDSLVTLEFGGDFNNPFVKVKFPPNLKHLKFNGKFNQFLKCKLPDSLESLELCGKYNKSIDELCFPQSLKKITFGGRFDKALNNIQFGVEELVFFNIKHNIDNLPASIKKIKLMRNDLILLIKKIPHDCIIVDKNDMILNKFL